MRFPGCEQGLEGSRHQFADRRSGGDRTLPQAPDQAAWKPDRKDVLAVGDGHGRGQLLGFAQVAIGLARRDGELAGEAFDGVGQVRILLQQRAGEIEPLGFLGIADAGHVTYNIYSTCLMSSLVGKLADTLKREVTFCVGGVVSPLLANLLLHHVLDQWFEREVKPRLHGDSLLVRYADDAVMLFENDWDGQRVLAVLDKRLGRYGLRLHPDKTRYLDFRSNRSHGQGQGTAFDFLGFTHYWVRSRKGYAVVRQTTAKSRFARALRAVNQWCRRHRHDAVHKQRDYLASVMRGHGNYYGLRGNSARLSSFHYQVECIWRKWLSRRSRKSRLNWDKMRELLRQHPLPRPRVRPATTTPLFD